MPRSSRFLLTTLATLTLFAASTPRAQSGAIRGFPDDALKSQREREEQFRKVPDSARLKEYMTAMAGEPHVAGRPGSKRVAEYALGQFKSWGLDARIETFEALMPWPTERVVEMVAPTRMTMAIAEPPLPEDPDTTDADSTPVFNAYSADGDATAEVVYVNYGMPADYERLQQLGVDVKGKIVLARYGGGWRGIKPKVASEHGAVGCLIYSDPRDDGYFAGDVYPWRSISSGAGRAARQRHGHADPSRRSAEPGLGLGAGRPQARTREARQPSSRSRCCRSPMATRCRCCKALKGPVVPEAWRGALPVTYHVGAGPGAGPRQARVRLADAPALQRHRPHRGLDVSRRVAHLRQPPRRLGERRRRSDERRGRADGNRARAGGAA